MKRTWILGIIAALIVLPAARIEAQRGRGRGNGERSEWHGERGERSGRDRKVVIADVDVRIINDYYARRHYRARPLPPGIAKNLARGKPLPPGIARTRMPAVLIAQLPPRPGVTWFLAGDVVIALGANNLVLDFVHIAY